MYTNFGAGEPNNAGPLGAENFLMIGGGNVWNDAASTATVSDVNGYFVEFEAPAVPEPSTFTLLGIGCVALLGYRWRTRKQVA